MQNTEEMSAQLKSFRVKFQGMAEDMLQESDVAEDKLHIRQTLARSKSLAVLFQVRVKNMAPESASVTSLYIYGGEVTAKGGKYGSGFGGGYGFGTNSASVSEISLKGSSKVENTKSDIIRFTSLIANGGDTSEKGVGNGKDGKATNVKTDSAALNCNNKYCDFKAESNWGRPWRCPSSGQSNCPQCALKVTNLIM